MLRTVEAAVWRRQADLLLEPGRHTVENAQMMTNRKHSVPSVLQT